MRPAVPEVELVDEPLTQGQRRQRGGRAIDESLIEVIELGLANPATVGELELIQMRAIPPRERGIDRLGQLAKPMRTGSRDPPCPGPALARGCGESRPGRAVNARSGRSRDLSTDRHDFGQPCSVKTFSQPTHPGDPDQLPTPRPPNGWAALTPTELLSVDLISAGHPNRSAAGELWGVTAHGQTRTCGPCSKSST